MIPLAATLGTHLTGAGGLFVVAALGAALMVVEVRTAPAEHPADLSRCLIREPRLPIEISIAAALWVGFLARWLLEGAPLLVFRSCCTVLFLAACFTREWLERRAAFPPARRAASLLVLPVVYLVAITL